MIVKKQIPNSLSQTLNVNIPETNIGYRQFEEMLIPQDVDKEDNQLLIEEGRAFATELNAKLASLNIPDSQLKALVKEIETFDFQHAFNSIPSNFRGNKYKSPDLHFYCCTFPCRVFRILAKFAHCFV